MDKKSEWIIKELKILEDQKKWDDCIYFFKKNLKNLKNKKYLYICINYFFMNLLLEEQDFSGKIKFDELYNLSIKYFNQSYKLFKNDAEYLYFVGKIMEPAPWYFNINDDDFSETIINKAIKLKPFSYFSKIEKFFLFKFNKLIKENKNFRKVMNNAELRFNFLKEYYSKNFNPKIINKLRKYGSFGEYFIQFNFRYFL